MKFGYASYATRRKTKKKRVMLAIKKISKAVLFTVSKRSMIFVIKYNHCIRARVTAVGLSEKSKLLQEIE